MYNKVILIGESHLIFKSFHTLKIIIYGHNMSMALRIIWEISTGDIDV